MHKYLISQIKQIKKLFEIVLCHHFIPFKARFSLISVA